MTRRRPTAKLGGKPVFTKTEYKSQLNQHNYRLNALERKQGNLRSYMESLGEQVRLVQEFLSISPHADAWRIFLQLEEEKHEGEKNK